MYICLHPSISPKSLNSLTSLKSPNSLKQARLLSHLQLLLKLFTTYKTYILYMSNEYIYMYIYTCFPPPPPAVTPRIAEFADIAESLKSPKLNPQARLLSHIQLLLKLFTSNALTRYGTVAKALRLLSEHAPFFGNAIAQEPVQWHERLVRVVYRLELWRYK